MNFLKEKLVKMDINIIVNNVAKITLNNTIKTTQTTKNNTVKITDKTPQNIKNITTIPTNSI